MFHVNYGEQSYFVEQLAKLLSSGMPVSAALFAILDEIKSPHLKSAVSEMQQNIEAGLTLSDAFRRSKIFPSYAVSLVSLGERIGELPAHLHTIAQTQEKERSFRSKIVSGMMYPAFVFVLTVVVGIAIAWLVLPRLATVFSTLKIQLPLITKILIWIGMFLGQWGLIVIPALILLMICLFFFLFLYRKTNFIGQQILFALPTIRTLLTEAELSRLGYLLGNMLDSGLPIADALSSLNETASFYNYQKLYRYLQQSIEEGSSFKSSFETYPLYMIPVKTLIPPSIQQLIVTAEQSGSLSKTLIHIGEMYEAKSETTTKNVTLLLEPVLLVIVWFGVLGVAIGVMLPLYSLIGNFGT